MCRLGVSMYRNPASTPGSRSMAAGVSHPFRAVRQYGGMIRAAAGVDDTAVQALVARARRDVDDGVLPSCQLALAKDGELVVDETFGAAPPPRYVVFSV